MHIQCLDIFFSSLQNIYFSLDLRPKLAPSKKRNIISINQMEELNSGKGMEIDEKGGTESKNDDGVVVRWEKFLPRMVMRVLLVESDDSTRQIITALLRKCSYKVAAVADGLKAWELLKGRPHNIDLILTEVELPSVSGFALLTLIAEHEICKNIPVIMMSAHDSVNTVYKCMLRGAADFLVKPVRKNELKNLWQHVWRRQNSLSEGAQATSDAQQKVEATAENNITSNHSSGYEACIQRNRDCIEKGSDAQSSCANPDLEAEKANLEDRQEDLTQQKQNKFVSSDVHMHTQKVGQCVQESEQMLMYDNGAHGEVAVPNTNAMNITSSRDKATAESQPECVYGSSEAFDKNNVERNSSREAIDLIGAFDKYPKCSYKSLGSAYIANKVDSSLDLTLRRSHPSGSVNQVTDDGHRLKQSEASAFSRYVSRTVQPLHSASSNQQQGYETSSDKQMSNQILDYNSDTRAPTSGPDNHMISLTNVQLEQSKNQFTSSQQKVTPVTVPVRGVNLENLSKYGSGLPPTFCMQPRHSSWQSPNSSAHQDPTFLVNQTYPYDPQTRSSPQLQYARDQNTHKDQTEHKQGHKLNLSQDRGHFSSATDQSGNSSFCNSTLNRINSINSGSNGIVNSLPNIKLGPESGNDSTQDGNCQRSIQREAALTKFRMKRKDRCYDKKVRYESRKKLAEQRPRVKGQFVRQLQTGGPSID